MFQCYQVPSDNKDGSTYQYVLTLKQELGSVAWQWLKDRGCKCDRVYKSNGTVRVLLIDPSDAIIKAIAKKYPLTMDTTSVNVPVLRPAA